MLILSSISSGLEFWSVRHTSIYKHFDSKVFRNIIFLGEISSNLPIDLRETNVYKALESLIMVVNNITMHEYCFSNFEMRHIFTIFILSHLRFIAYSLFQILNVWDDILLLF